MVVEANPYLFSFAKQLWEASNGWIKLQPYDREQPASYYINKLISDGAVPYERNLERLHYAGATDLGEACKSNTYVADRLKEKTFGKYLVALRINEVSEATASRIHCLCKELSRPRDS